MYSTALTSGGWDWLLSNEEPMEGNTLCMNSTLYSMWFSKGGRKCDGFFSHGLSCSTTRYTALIKNRWLSFSFLSLRPYFILYFSASLTIALALILCVWWKSAQRSRRSEDGGSRDRRRCRGWEKNPWMDGGEADEWREMQTPWKDGSIFLFLFEL